MAQPSIQPHQIAVDKIYNDDNIIINGQMDIWQRDVLGNARNLLDDLVSDVYFPDQFLVTCQTPSGSGNVVSVTKSSDVPVDVLSGKPVSSMKIDVLTAPSSVNASSYLRFIQPVEGYRGRKVYGRVCTLSFWVKSSLIGTYATGAMDSQFGYSYVVPYTINVANTWEFKQVLINFDGTILDAFTQANKYTNDSLFGIFWTLHAGSNGHTSSPNTWETPQEKSTSSQVNFLGSNTSEFYITSVDLRVGDYTKGEISPYVPRSLQEEFVLSKRYCERSYPMGVSIGTISVNGYSRFRLTELPSDGSRLAGWTERFSVEKRSQPTMVVYNWATGFSGSFRDNENNTNATVSVGLRETGVSFNVTMDTPLKTTFDVLGHWVAEAKLTFNN